MIDDGLKAIFNDFQGGSAFDRTLEASVAEQQGRLKDIDLHVPQNLTLLADHVTSRLSTIGNRYTATADRLVSFKDHVSNHLDHIADNITLFSSSQQLENAMSNQPQNSCGDMHSFFGSVTREGPGLLDQIKSNIGLAYDTFKEVTETYTELQQEVASVKNNLLANLDQQIALEVNDAKRAILVDARGQLDTQFGGGSRDLRESLISTATGLLTEARRTAAQKSAALLKQRDDAAEQAATAMDQTATQMDEAQQQMGAMISSEQAKIQQANQKLTQLSSASNLRSLYKSDPCVQTLLGYVGSDSLLKNLGVA